MVQVRKESRILHTVDGKSRREVWRGKVDTGKDKITAHMPAISEWGRTDVKHRLGKSLVETA